MGVCDDTCNCEAEGDRGLVVTGTGDAGSPFVVSPDAARTIPSTFDTYADLPALTAAELGQLAFVKDTGLVYVWSSSASALEDDWQVVAPDWDAIAPANANIAATGVDVTTASIALRDGRWDILASGYLDITVAVATSTVVRLDLVDTATGTVYDRKVCTLANDSAAPESRTQPFMLMRMLSSGPGSADPAGTDKLVAIRMQRTSGDASVGIMTQIAIRAVRVASHGVF